MVLCLGREGSIQELTVWAEEEVEHKVAFGRGSRRRVRMTVKVDGEGEDKEGTGGDQGEGVTSGECGEG